MMIRSSATAMILGAALMASAQSPAYNDLLFNYVDGK